MFSDNNNSYIEAYGIDKLALAKESGIALCRRALQSKLLELEDRE